jgi:hypothetical protein
MSNPGDIATRTTKARDQARLGWITAGYENDREPFSGSFGGTCSWQGPTHDNSYPPADQFGCKSR